MVGPFRDSVVLESVVSVSGISPTVIVIQISTKPVSREVVETGDGQIKLKSPLVEILVRHDVPAGFECEQDGVSD